MIWPNVAMSYVNVFYDALVLKSKTLRLSKAEL